MKLIWIKDVESLSFNDKGISNLIELKCWVRSNRDSGKIGFIVGYDGSTLNDIQIVYKRELTKNFDVAKTIRSSAAIYVKGYAQRNPNISDSFEIIAEEIQLLKQSTEDNPLQKKQHSYEFLREIAHLRGRTKTMQAIMNVRNALAYSIHKFFQDNNFYWISTPILTSNDCEGAGENFNIEENADNPFFTPKAKLTVSGQLNAECYAQALGRVYTFGPTFRAERSHTNRHMAEFWMVEPEIAFINLDQLIVIIETFIKTIVKNTMEKCPKAIKFFAKNKPEINKRLDKLINDKFVKITYSEVIKILKKAIQDGHKFEDNDIFFGKDLASEHERYICEHVYNCPVFVYNYPKDIKAFYMKLNDDDQTVAAVDLLVPGVGEIIGGSQREDDYDKLIKRVNDLKIDVKSIQWYVDLRKYGYESSAGFGLGFERLIMYILDLDNIRDAIPFPRYEGKLLF